MINKLFNLKQIGAHKAEVGAGVDIILKTEPELEPKQIVSAPQHWTEGICVRIWSTSGGKLGDNGTEEVFREEGIGVGGWEVEWGGEEELGNIMRPVEK